MPSVGQLEYELTIWRSKLRNERAKAHTMIEQIAQMAKIKDRSNAFAYVQVRSALLNCVATPEDFDYLFRKFLEQVQAEAIEQYQQKKQQKFNLMTILTGAKGISFGKSLG